MKSIIVLALIMQIIASILFNYSIYIISKEKFKPTREAIIGMIAGIVVTTISFIRWTSLLN